MVQPHAACVTTVGPVHIENFADGEAGVARAKAEIFEGLGPGGVAVLNADNRWFDLLHRPALRRPGRAVATFGSRRGLRRPPDRLPARAEGGAGVTAELHGQALDFPLAQTGFHWGLNSLAVLLMLEALDVPLETALAALADFAAAGRPGRRDAGRACAGGAFTLIDESYNANPMSMAAALPQPGRAPVAAGGRRIVVADRHAGAGRRVAAPPRRPGRRRSTPPASTWSSAPGR